MSVGNTGMTMIGGREMACGAVVGLVAGLLAEREFVRRLLQRL